jgi:hypothetical protein
MFMIFEKFQVNGILTGFQEDDHGKEVVHLMTGGGDASSVDDIRFPVCTGRKPDLQGTVFGDMLKSGQRVPAGVFFLKLETVDQQDFRQEAPVL